MLTNHSFHYDDAGQMTAVAPESIDLVVTSPPYPMIAMWDDLFSDREPIVAQALEDGNAAAAYEGMHAGLDAVWKELFRVLKPGAMVCINVGDATRTIGGNFALYPNHSRIQSCMLSLGFTALPSILWRKQTNAPNKFMGSGMLPAGAYVTMEHEYILIFRKGPKRTFPSPRSKAERRQSALFWEERNQWFSDIWLDLKGTRQSLGDPDLRKRSAAFPFEVPYRLINMFSLKGDTVLDPFNGTATTTAAAIAAGRNSVGYEIVADFKPTVTSRVKEIPAAANHRIQQRLIAHSRFVESRYREKGAFRHRNVHYGFPVVTRQEVELLLAGVTGVEWESNGRIQAVHDTNTDDFLCRDWQAFFSEGTTSKMHSPKGGDPKHGPQMELFGPDPKLQGR